MMKLLQAPWLVFLVLGGALYALYAVYPRPEVRPVIHIADSQVATWLEAHRLQLRAPLTEEQEQRLIDRLVVDEILVQEALELKLQYLPVVQQRLKNIGEFIQSDAGSPSDDPVARAVELGLLQSDQVVRRYLVGRMEQLLLSSAPVELSPEDVRTYFERHIEDYMIPARVDIEHIFFSEDRGRSADDARALLADIGELAEPLEEGDVFFSGYRFRARTEQQLGSLFGTDFAAAVFELPAGVWSGPVRSAFGWHLVRITAVQEAATPELATVESKVRGRLRYDREREALERMLELIKARYEVVIEGQPPEGYPS